MSDEATFSIVTIVKDDPITGVEYGPVNVPYQTPARAKTEFDVYQKHLQAIKSKRMRAEKQKQK